MCRLCFGMKITGIIAEYNPFHNGHKYHLEETRRITGADYIIAVISGDFVQRGAPAIMDKYLRTEAALKNGVDLVLELPLFYAAGSAEYFAMGAVTLLDKLGCVNALCFGSECGSVVELSAIASVLAKEPEEYRIFLQKELKCGHSFPKARSLTLKAFLNGFSYKSFLEPSLFSSPNNILGTEYIKSLLIRNSSIVPCTIKRTGSQYHDTVLTPAAKQPEAGKALGSATALRRMMAGNGALSALRPYVPASVYPLLEQSSDRRFPVCSNDFSTLLHYKLLQDAPDGFYRYLDVTHDLSDKICRNLPGFTGYDAFCSLLKSKDVTYARLSRSLLHILLNMEKAQMEEYIQNDYIAYARILGFCKTASPLLKVLKAHTAVPVISKLSGARRLLTAEGYSMLEQDIRASHIYRSVTASKFRVPFTHEYAIQPIIV